MTDHTYFNPAEYAGFVSTYSRPSFLLMSGEEVTDSSTDRGPIHIIGLNINTVVGTHGGTSIEAISGDVAGIIAADGTAIYAHPNYGCCAAVNDFMAVPALKFMEVLNPAVSDSNDNLWDLLLTSMGSPIYATASDDEHSLVSGWALPGQAWITVRAASLTTANILTAMQKGDFYASSGVELANLQVTPTSYGVIVNPIAGHSYRIEFFGQNGNLLRQTFDKADTYTFTGTELYVRAKVTDLSAGDSWAWTQPTFVVTQPPILVTVAPATATLNKGESTKFVATVTGSASQGVTWSATPNIGTLTASGKYTAPSVTAQMTVTITATSKANPAKGTATVTIIP